MSNDPASVHRDVGDDNVVYLHKQHLPLIISDHNNNKKNCIYKKINKLYLTTGEMSEKKLLQI